MLDGIRPFRHPIRAIPEILHPPIAMNTLVCDAIRARRLLRFVYEGYERVVEPHLYGINTANHEMLGAYLVGGWSRTETAPGWRNYLVREMYDVHVLAEPFSGARTGYNADDPAFRQIHCRLPEAGATDARPPESD